MQPTQIIRPDRTKLYGVTHSMEGAPLRRQTRSLKIGIGLIKGKDINLWINADGVWVIEIGSYKEGRRVKGGARTTYTSRREAEAAYATLYKQAPERKYPGKLPFFTFLHPNEDGTGFLHDFAAIEAHGPMPTEIDIFFTINTPFVASYEWWSKSKLNCWGDGRNALRKVDLAHTAEEKELAKNPVDNNYFPIIGGCAEGGCPYCIQQEEDKPKLCRPHGRLACQLSNSPSLGSTCTFDTTGFRSTQQLGSSLTEILEATGQGDPTKGVLVGIPLKLVLRPYAAYPNGKLTTLYAVNVEFKPKNQKEAEQITQTMLRYVSDYRAMPQIAAPAIEQLQLEAPTAGWNDEDEADEAEIMEAEFYPQKQEGSPEAAAAVIDAKKEELRARGAKVTEIPKTETKPEPEKAESAHNPTRNKVPASPELAKAFAQIKKDLLAETGSHDKYYQILNGAGYPKSNEIPTIEEGKRIYKLMLGDLRNLQAAKDAETNAVTEESDAAEPEVEPESTLTPEESDAREDWLPDGMRTEAPHIVELRALEVRMKTARKGGLYGDLLGVHGAERTEQVTAAAFPELKKDIEFHLAKVDEAPKTGKLKL